MVTITLNNLNISSGNYKVNTIQHDSGTPLNLNTLEIAREDGVKLISTNYGVKRFVIEGQINGATQEACEYNLDTFKKTISGVNLNLDISYGYGRTRRYIVAVTNISLPREFFNLTFVPYTIELEVQDPPFGQESNEETIFSGSSFTLPDETFSCVFSGTAEPKPIVEMTMDTVGSLGNISLKNQTTNTQMDIYTGWSNSDLLQIDTANKTVQKNSQDIEFEGIFPECELGLNNWSLGLSLTTSIDQQQTTVDAYSGVYGATWLGQSFQCSAANYYKIDVIMKAPTLYGNVLLRIETNNAGSPSGTLVNANAEYEVIAELIPTSPGWVSFEFPASFALSAGTTYWVVIKCINTTASAPLQPGYGNGNPYTSGSWKYSLNSGSTWNDFPGIDLAFKLYKVVTPDFSVDTKVKYTRRYL